MKKILFLLLFLIPAIAFSQAKCDTIVNRNDYLKLVYLVKDCDEEVKIHQEHINSLERKIYLYQKRISVLENLIIEREKFKIKKCPKFKNKNKSKFPKSRL